MVARLFVLLCLALAAAPAASAQTFNGQEQAEIRAIVREYLVRNPDVLREALDALAERNTAERWQQIRNDPRDFAVGPADAAVTIVEFYDYRCTYCHHAMEWVIDLTRTRRDLRVVFKELPILGPSSMEAAVKARTLRVLTDGPQDESPSYAPNGAMLVYSTDARGARVLGLVSADGASKERLASERGNVREPAWSPFPAR